MTLEIIHLTIQCHPSNDLSSGSSLKWACLWLLGRVAKEHHQTKTNTNVVFTIFALFLRFSVKTKNVLFLGKHPFVLNYKECDTGQQVKTFSEWWENHSLADEARYLNNIDDEISVSGQKHSQFSLECTCFKIQVLQSYYRLPGSGFCAFTWRYRIERYPHKGKFSFSRKRAGVIS